MKRTTPFKSIAEFEKDITSFANKHHAHFCEHAKRVSDYFEMTCYNLIVHYYENLGYKMEPCRLVGGDFRYKCSPAGLLQNFSYFKGIKCVGDEEEVVYVFHNATVQSAHDDQVFTTPDIVVSHSDDYKETTDYYSTRKRLSYVANHDMIAFCESKLLIPFPELMINFIGTVNELRPECLTEEGCPCSVDHIAPSLMMSGTMSKQCGCIKKSLEHRYYVNFLSDLLYSPMMRTFSKKGMKRIATLNKKKDNDVETTLS